jgi:hypothetical protein
VERAKASKDAKLSEEAMQGWHSDISVMCKEGYLSLGHLPFILNTGTNLRTPIIPTHLKPKVHLSFIEAVENFGFKPNQPRTISSEHPSLKLPGQRL